MDNTLYHSALSCTLSLFFLFFFLIVCCQFVSVVVMVYKTCIATVIFVLSNCIALTLIMAVFNACSVGTPEKKTEIADFIIDLCVDVLFLTETWLRRAGD